MQKDISTYTEIPGWCPQPQLRLISELASLVPKQGTIIEIGSLLGRSLCCWSDFSDPSVSVYAIDPWQGDIKNPFVGYDDQRGTMVDMPNTFENFQNTLKKYNVSKVTPIQEFSPLNHWNNSKADVIYIDGDHSFQALTDDLEFWMNHLVDDGLICGDDFITSSPEVMRAVLDFSSKNNLQVVSFWKAWALIGEKTNKNYVNVFDRLRSKTVSLIGDI